MPERSFGRTVRYRRNKLGMSQSKLAELVGRSASTIRSWERDVSVPSDATVITALSAVLDVDQRTLFEKAGLEAPEHETSPTVEQALASLTLEAAAGTQPAVAILPEGDQVATAVEDPEPDIELDLGHDLGPLATTEPPEAETEDGYPVWEPEPPPDTLWKPPVTSSMAAPTTPVPGFVEPPDPFVFTAATPPMVEPSYMEDSSQRQLYRVRNLATVVLLVALVVVLLWAFSGTVDAIGAWWDDFFGTLRL